jgi:hypothetical protein
MSQSHVLESPTKHLKDSLFHNELAIKQGRTPTYSIKAREELQYKWLIRVDVCNIFCSLGQFDNLERRNFFKSLFIINSGSNLI